MNLFVFLGGITDNVDEIVEDKIRNEIIEYNPNTEQWVEIGEMINPLFSHGISVVNYEDYEQWCN